MPTHIVKSYDEQLRKLNDTLARMGGVVEAQISAAMQALARRDPDLAMQTVEGDRRVDALEREVDTQVVNLLGVVIQIVGGSKDSEDGIAKNSITQPVCRSIMSVIAPRFWL
ncbi:MAG: PhoU domain-containing protein, partial [Actinomycetota bacterium]